MNSPTSIVTELWRKLAASSDSVTNVRQIPQGDAPNQSVPPLSLSWRTLILPVGFGLLLLWAFAPTFAELAHSWSTDPEYSHGYLVPGFALVLLWLRRERFTTLVSGCSAWGLAFVGLGVLIRFAADYLYMDWLDASALLPCVVGLTLLLGGKAALRWAWPAIAFLAFMIPLPYSLKIGLAYPLQRVATLASTYCLQTLGFPALSEGNVILLNDTRMGVERACSGLSMLVIFFALSTAFAFVVKKPLWQKLLLVVSALPIALISNITRITVTGIMHETVGHRAANLVFHDLAGWLMMPFALAILWLELAALGRLVLEVPAAGRGTFAAQGASPISPSGKGSKRRRAPKSFLPPKTPGPRQL